MALTRTAAYPTAQPATPAGPLGRPEPGTPVAAAALLPFEYFNKGNVQLFGDKDYSIRIWLNPRQLAAYNLTPAEVMTAI